MCLEVVEDARHLGLNRSGAAAMRPFTTFWWVLGIEATAKRRQTTNFLRWMAISSVRPRGRGPDAHGFGHAQQCESHMHTYPHAFMHTHMHACTHACTCALSISLPPCLSVCSCVSVSLSPSPPFPLCLLPCDHVGRGLLTHLLISFGLTPMLRHELNLRNLNVPSLRCLVLHSSTKSTEHRNTPE
jgi:hypothetical protein